MSALVAVRERPILFSGPMVRAILDGSKTQTRRVVSDATSQGNWKASELDLSAAWVDPGPSPAGNAGPYLKASPTLAAMTAKWSDAEMAQAELGHITDRLYPRWFPGDRLWVRETHTLLADHFGLTAGIHYEADDSLAWNVAMPDGLMVYNVANRDVWKRRPSIFMLRAHSRLTLELTDVRVERVQEISEADALAEGVAAFAEAYMAKGNPRDLTAVEQYEYLWDSLNDSRGYGWDENPWVWVLSFTRVQP